ncbi:aldehyde dehydrogenase family protein [Alkalihalobacillus deserti]|uniref:aldehyde dehydrogenase family protein n=1 Tax=Alkalihalobacillus deserti TaxID=2879466 RepID=UPI001D14414F|nr:aldehyde dehydrogenase family protein [Alkalihalobacillus deserti]
MKSYSEWFMCPIAGEWRDGSSDRVLSVENPYTNKELVKIKMATTSDVNKAYEEAERVQKKWAQTSPYEKEKILRKAADLLEERREQIVDLIINEAGGSRIKANMEVSGSINLVKEAASYPFQMETRIFPSIVPGKTNMVIKEPVGVVSIITPWNFPFSLSMRSVAPALATGNGVVIKPSLDTPITGGLLLAKIFEDAGLPAGLISVIVASSQDIGNSFITNSVPKIVSFTGSTEVGRKIAQVAGENLKKVSLELGGNNAFIVLDDANIENAAKAAVFGKFLHQGQICMAINRIIVDKAVYNEFVEKFVHKVSNLKVGDPENQETVIGPLINQKQVETVKGLLEKGIEEGAKVALEGKIVGNVVTPFVLTDVKNNMSIAQSEIFGPIALIIPVQDEDEAVRIANDSQYGLSGAVFSRSTKRALNVAKQIKTGMIHINDQTVNNEPMVPFGGEKDSGIGRHGGEWSVEEFTTVKWISLQEKERAFPFGASN